jgi:Xaa-Pro aminopeptidase
VYAERLLRAREGMATAGIDVLLLSLGADLPYLTGYEAMPLERLTMLVLPRDGEAALVVPRLEAPRVVERPEAFRLVAWEETDDPVAIVAGLAGTPRVAAIGDRTWATFLLDLQALLPSTSWRQASTVTSPLRSVKDTAEITALRRASAAADRVAAQLQEGQIPLVGRTEAEVSADLGRRLVDEGHARVNFAIVGSGPNAASPHHEPGSRVIGAGEVVLCDFGGTMPDGYCSDTTRCVWTGGEVPAEFRDLYRVLESAQAEAVDAATVGTPCEDVDAVARRLITEGGYGPLFVHRVGHGIGLEAHEDPYLVGGNCTALVAGHAFSIEPGIYVEGRWGARIEDIVVAADAGPEALNRSDHGLVVVEA